MSHIGFVLNLFGLLMSTEWDQGSVITRHLYAPAVKQSRNPVRIPAGTGNQKYFHINIIGLLNVLIIYMKKLLDSDWLRAVQFSCNTSAKSVTPVQKV